MAKDRGAYHSIHKRESIYPGSMISTTATGGIAGLGSLGYLLAIDAIAAAVSVYGHRPHQQQDGHAATAQLTREE
jgi:phosphoglycerate dehydrogenase-like enzyme